MTKTNEPSTLDMKLFYSNQNADLWKSCAQLLNEFKEWEEFHSITVDNARLESSYQVANLSNLPINSENILDDGESFKSIAENIFDERAFNKINKNVSVEVKKHGHTTQNSIIRMIVRHRRHKIINRLKKNERARFGVVITNIEVLLNKAKENNRFEHPIVEKELKFLKLHDIGKRRQNIYVGPKKEKQNFSFKGHELLNRNHSFRLPHENKYEKSIPFHLSTPSEFSGGLRRVISRRREYYIKTQDLIKDITLESPMDFAERKKKKLHPTKYDTWLMIYLRNHFGLSVWVKYEIELMRNGRIFSLPTIFARPREIRTDKLTICFFCYSMPHWSTKIADNYSIKNDDHCNLTKFRYPTTVWVEAIDAYVAKQGNIPFNIKFVICPLPIYDSKMTNVIIEKSRTFFEEVDVFIQTNGIISGNKKPAIINLSKGMGHFTVRVTRNSTVSQLMQDEDTKIKIQKKILTVLSSVYKWCSERNIKIAHQLKQRTIKMNYPVFLKNIAAQPVFCNEKEKLDAINVDLDKIEYSAIVDNPDQIIIEMQIYTIYLLKSDLLRIKRVIQLILDREFQHEQNYCHEVIMDFCTNVWRASKSHAAAYATRGYYKIMGKCSAPALSESPMPLAEALESHFNIPVVAIQFKILTNENKSLIKMVKLAASVLVEICKHHGFFLKEKIEKSRFNEYKALGLFLSKALKKYINLGRLRNYIRAISDAWHEKKEFSNSHSKQNKNGKGSLTDDGVMSSPTTEFGVVVINRENEFLAKYISEYLAPDRNKYFTIIHAEDIFRKYRNYISVAKEIEKYGGSKISKQKYIYIFMKLMQQNAYRSAVLQNFCSFYNLHQYKLPHNTQNISTLGVRKANSELIQEQKWSSENLMHSTGEFTKKEERSTSSDKVKSFIAYFCKSGLLYRKTKIINNRKSLEDRKFNELFLSVESKINPQPQVERIPNRESKSTTSVVIKTIVKQRLMREAHQRWLIRLRIHKTRKLRKIMTYFYIIYKYILQENRSESRFEISFNQQSNNSLYPNKGQIETYKKAWKKLLTFLQQIKSNYLKSDSSFIKKTKGIARNIFCYCCLAEGTDLLFKEILQDKSEINTDNRRFSMLHKQLKFEVKNEENIINNLYLQYIFLSRKEIEQIIGESKCIKVPEVDLHERHELSEKMSNTSSLAICKNTLLELQGLKHLSPPFLAIKKLTESNDNSCNNCESSNSGKEIDSQGLFKITNLSKRHVPTLNRTYISRTLKFLIKYLKVRSSLCLNYFQRLNEYDKWEFPHLNEEINTRSKINEMFPFEVPGANRRDYKTYLSIYLSYNNVISRIHMKLLKYLDDIDEIYFNEPHFFKEWYSLLMIVIPKPKHPPNFQIKYNLTLATKKYFDERKTGMYTEMKNKDCRKLEKLIFTKYLSQFIYEIIIRSVANYTLLKAYHIVCRKYKDVVNRIEKIKTLYLMNPICFISEWIKVIVAALQGCVALNKGVPRTRLKKKVDIPINELRMNRINAKREWTIFYKYIYTKYCRILSVLKKIVKLFETKRDYAGKTKSKWASEKNDHINLGKTQSKLESRNKVLTSNRCRGHCKRNNYLCHSFSHLLRPKTSTGAHGKIRFLKSFSSQFKRSSGTILNYPVADKSSQKKSVEPYKYLWEEMVRVKNLLKTGQPILKTFMEKIKRIAKIYFDDYLGGGHSFLLRTSSKGNMKKKKRINVCKFKDFSDINMLKCVNIFYFNAENCRRIFSILCGLNVNGKLFCFVDKISWKCSNKLFFYFKNLGKLFYSVGFLLNKLVKMHKKINYLLPKEWKEKISHHLKLFFPEDMINKLARDKEDKSIIFMLNPKKTGTNTRKQRAGFFANNLSKNNIPIPFDFKILQEQRNSFCPGILPSSQKLAVIKKEMFDFSISKMLKINNHKENYGHNTTSSLQYRKLIYPRPIITKSDLRKCRLEYINREMEGCKGEISLRKKITKKHDNLNVVIPKVRKLLRSCKQSSDFKNTANMGVIIRPFLGGKKKSNQGSLLNTTKNSIKTLLAVRKKLKDLYHFKNILFFPENNTFSHTYCNGQFGKRKYNRDLLGRNKEVKTEESIRYGVRKSGSLG